MEIYSFKVKYRFLMFWFVITRDFGVGFAGWVGFQSRSGDVQQNPATPPAATNHTPRNPSIPDRKIPRLAFVSRIHPPSHRPTTPPALTTPAQPPTNNPSRTNQHPSSTTHQPPPPPANTGTWQKIRRATKIQKLWHPLAGCSLLGGSSGLSI